MFSSVVLHQDGEVAVGRGSGDVDVHLCPVADLPPDIGSVKVAPAGATTIAPYMPLGPVSTVVDTAPPLAL